MSEGLDKPFVESRRNYQVCKLNSNQVNAESYGIYDSMHQAHVALQAGLKEICQKTDSIAHSRPVLKSQVKVLQAQVVGLCYGQEHGTPSSELLAHLTEAQRARDRLVAQTEVLQASNEHNSQRDCNFQVVLNRINSDMVTMRRKMQTQGEGVGEEVKEGFTGLHERLTAHREHVSDTQEQFWAHAHFFGRRH